MIYDITVPISNKMPVWPGDPSVIIERDVSIDDGAPCNVSSMQMGVHTGTHIDAPFHFLQCGKTVEELSLEICMGKTFLLEVDAPLISRENLLGKIPKGTKRLLLKTKNSHLWKDSEHSFDTSFTAIDKSAAQYLVDMGIQLIGIDYLSIEAFNAEEGNPVHKILLESEVIILEGLNLSEVSEGEYTLTALPLKINGVDGSPCRAILTT